MASLPRVITVRLVPANPQERKQHQDDHDERDELEGRVGDLSGRLRFIRRGVLSV